MNRQRKIIVGVGLLLMITVVGVTLRSYNQKQAAEFISKSFSQVVFPRNFIRVNDYQTFLVNTNKFIGFNETPIHIYVYRASGDRQLVITQLEQTFIKSGFKTNTSGSQIDASDSQIHTTAVFQSPPDSSRTERNPEQVIAISVKKDD